MANPIFSRLFSVMLTLVTAAADSPITAFSISPDENYMAFYQKANGVSGK